MKKNFFKLMALMAVALPMAMLSSCSDDDNEENNNENNENTEQTIKEVDIKMDGVDFVKKNWLKYDDNGNVIGVGIGKVIYEAEPTVAYVGVEDLKDALMHFDAAVRPANASMKLVKGNWQAILVDTLGNEQNRIHFDKVDDGKVLAKAYLDKKIGIESYITEIRYIPASLWPENAIGGNAPFRVGCVYTFKSKNYVCVRSNGYGQDGLLVCDANNKEYIGTKIQSFSEQHTANYPNLNTCKEIHKELSNTVSGSRLWQLFCASAGQKNLKDFKTRQYWTSTVDGGNILLMNFAANNDDGKWIETETRIEWFWDIYTGGTYYWELFVYRFSQNEKGEASVWKSNNHIWMDEVKDYQPKVSEFVRNEKIEKDSESISLQ